MLKWDDLPDVKRFFKAPMRDLHKYGELMSECKGMLNHVDRYLNEVVFVRCKDRTCFNKWSSKILFKHLGQFKFRLPAPTLGKYYDGHYETFLRRCVNKEGKFGDDAQPTANKTALGKCVLCPNFNFKSETSSKRHKTMFHRRQKSAFREADFDCSECGKLFKSKSALNNHKKKKNHITKKARATAPKNKQKTKQRTINDMFRQHAGTRKVENDNQGESCESLNCVINEASTALISWVVCENCGSWYHSVSVGLGDKNPAEITNIEDTCDDCN